MKATIALVTLIVLFSMPGSCQQKVTSPVGVCVQSSALKFTPSTLPQAFIGTAYSASLSAMVSGGTAPYTWAVTSGTLPAGITLSSVGTLSGTPTAAGTFTFSVTVTDSSVSCAPTALAAKDSPRHQSVTVAVKAAI